MRHSTDGNGTIISFIWSSIDNTISYESSSLISQPIVLKLEQEHAIGVVAYYIKLYDTPLGPCLLDVATRSRHFAREHPTALLPH